MNKASMDGEVSTFLNDSSSKLNCSEEYAIEKTGMFIQNITAVKTIWNLVMVLLTFLKDVKLFMRWWEV